MGIEQHIKAEVITTINSILSEAGQKFPLGPQFPLLEEGTMGQRGP